MTGRDTPGNRIGKAVIEIDGWRAGTKFSASHFIPGHARCSRIHGHSYAIHVRIEGEIGKNGFLIDFGAVKAIVKEIADSLDHRLLIPGKNPDIVVEKKEGQIEIKNIHENKFYSLPAEDCLVLPIEYTTAEYLSMYVKEMVEKRIDEEHKLVKWKILIGIDEGPGQGAWWLTE